MKALIILKHFVSVFLVNLNHFITIDWHCTNCKHRLYPNLSTCLTIVPVKWPTVNCQLVAMSQTHTHTCTQHTCTHTSVTDDTNSNSSGKLHLRQLHFLSRRSSFLLSFLFSIVVVSQRCKAAGAAVVGNFTVFAAAAAAPNGLFVAHQCCRFRFFFRQKKTLIEGQLRETFWYCRKWSYLFFS